MSNFNYNAANEKLVALDETILSTKTSKNNGIKTCIVEIESKLTELNAKGLKGRKAKTSAKKSILSDITGATDKSMNRAYTIAFNIVFRDIRIATDRLTVAQVENLSKHGTVNEINDMFELEEEVYCSAVTSYLKSLKTREVITKTYEKKSNQR